MIEFWADGWWTVVSCFLVLVIVAAHFEFGAAHKEKS